MKTLDDYTIYCTEEQTKKAFELGAHLKYNYQATNIVYIKDNGYFKIPTAEQMMGWLEELGVTFDKNYIAVHITSYNTEYIATPIYNKSSKEAKLAAIDAALDYLINNKK